MTDSDGVISYTAVILLAFNRWTNKIEREEIIDFQVARIIFCACILVSFILLGIDWFIAVKVMKTDGVAEAYLNVIAVRWNCIWGGKGKGDSGWKRFLVFSKLTSSRGFHDYIALFTYFSFKGWLRIIVAEGPRVVINALTFISVFKLQTLVKDKNASEGFDKFWTNVSELYKDDKMQVIVLGTMAFTTLLWALAILRLLLASILYGCFLWHAMGEGNNLRGYCKERIDTRMGAIMQKKHDKAVAAEKQKRRSLLRQPTLPLLVSGESQGYHPEAMSSTAKLVPSPPESVRMAPTKVDMNREPTLPKLNREPVVPNISELERGIKSPGAMSGIHHPAPARTMTRRTNESHDGYSTPPPQYGKGQDHPDEYQMQPLPRSHTAQPLNIPPVNNWHDTAMNSPALMMDSPTLISHSAGPRAHTADPYAGAGYDGQGYGANVPGPRSHTAGPGYGGAQQFRGPHIEPPPMSRSGSAAPSERGYGPPPPRSNTAGPMSPAYGPPTPRSNTAGPMHPAYNPQVPRSNTSGPMSPAYHPPPPRSHTATPMDGEYQGPFQSPSFPSTPRSQTPTTPGFVLPFDAPDRSNTAPIEENYYQPPTDPVYARSQTTGPIEHSFPQDITSPTTSTHSNPLSPRQPTTPGPRPYAAKKYIPARLTEHHPESPSDELEKPIQHPTRQWTGENIIPPSPRRFQEERRPSGETLLPLSSQGQGRRPSEKNAEVGGDERRLSEVDRGVESPREEGWVKQRLESPREEGWSQQKQQTPRHVKSPREQAWPMQQQDGDQHRVDSPRAEVWQQQQAQHGVESPRQEAWPQSPHHNQPRVDSPRADGWPQQQQSPRIDSPRQEPRPQQQHPPHAETPLQESWPIQPQQPQDPNQWR